MGGANVSVAPSWLDADAIKAAVSSFNPHWGGGPAGLRPAHVKEALSAAHSDLVLGSLAAHTLVGERGG